MHHLEAAVAVDIDEHHQRTKPFVFEYLRRLVLEPAPFDPAVKAGLRRQRGDAPGDLADDRIGDAVSVEIDDLRVYTCVALLELDRRPHLKPDGVLRLRGER